MAITQEQLDKILGNKRKPSDNVNYGSNYNSNPLSNVDIFGSLGTQLRQMANNAYVNVPNTVRAIGAEASSDPFVKMFQPITPKPKQNYTVSQAPADYKEWSLGDQRIQDAASILLDPINAIPFAGTAAKGVVKGAKYLGKEALRQVDTGTGVLGKIVPDMNMYAVPNINGIPYHEILYPNRTLDSLTSAEKSALTKFTKGMQIPAFNTRETLKYSGTGDVVSPDHYTFVERKGINPEILLNKILVPVAGDMARTGGKVQQIAGNKLVDPYTELPMEVERQGGNKFPFIKENFDNNIGWGSELSAAKSKVNNFEKYADTGKDVLGVYQSLAPEGINFSHHVAQGMIGQLKKLNPSKDAIRQLNIEIQNTPHTVKNPKTGVVKVTYPYKNFSGVTDENIANELLQGTSTSSAGNLRKVIIEKMGLDKYKKLGFPSYEDTRIIMSEPDLYTGASGKTIFQSDVSGKVVTPAMNHFSYGTSIPRLENGLLGGIEDASGNIVSVPDDALWRKLFAEKRAKGATEHGIRRSMMMSHQGEVFDQESLDNVMKILGYAK
jgi:hypothetical protein